MVRLASETDVPKGTQCRTCWSNLSGLNEVHPASRQAAKARHRPRRLEFATTRMMFPSQSLMSSERGRLKLWNKEYLRNSCINLTVSLTKPQIHYKMRKSTSF